MKIAFYLNLQGMGHCRRFEAIAPYFPTNCQLAVIGMDGPPAVDKLSRPIERISVPGFGPASDLPFMQQQTAPDYHGLLVNHGQNTAFVLAMVSFFSRWQPDLLVVDVGLEASILARMCGIPTLYVRQHGHRWDKGHRLAYEWACALWAPFSAKMEQLDCPDWIQRKTFYSGGFSRFSGLSSSLSSGMCKIAKKMPQKMVEAPASYAKTKPNILVMTGFGGTTITPEKISIAAAATPDWQWHYLGKRLNMVGVCSEGIVENVWPYLSHADLVIANAGHNSVMEIAAASVPAIFIPAERPFSEQICKSQTLKRLNLGIVVEKWPTDSQWHDLKQQAHSQDLSQWQQVQDGGAAQRAARFIAKIAEQCTKTNR